MTGERPSDESFEGLYARLEEVTNTLEGGQLTLEQSISLYEEGMRLAQRCQALLADVEQRIQVLRETYDNGFER
ncbi:MAG: exodeoxyribonuclease VII small subunit [Dehalococcoidia bacterium]